MASLNELLGSSPAPLSSLLSDETPGSSLPQATARNRAATVAIQTGEPVQNFQSVMYDDAVGRTDTIDDLGSQISEVNQESDFQALMSVLSDPNTPEEIKPNLIQSFQESERLNDKTYSLMDSALMAPNGEENIEQEAARLSIADTLGEYYKHKSEMQGLVNQFMIDNNQSWQETALDFGAIMVPGTEAVTNANISQAIYEALGMPYSAGNTLRDAVAPGFSGLAVRERFKSLPEDEQIQAVSKILNAIKHNNAIMAGDENQVRSMIMLERFLHGDYDTTDAVIDSVFNVLDIVGIGALVRGGFRAARGSQGLRAINEASPSPDLPLPVKASPTAPDRLTGAMVDSRASEIKQLEEEYTTLLSQTQSALDPGSVRGLRKELDDIVNQHNAIAKTDTTPRTRELQAEGMRARAAKAVAEKEVKDQLVELKSREEAIRTRLNINSQTEKAASKLPTVERKLAEARKNTKWVPATLNPIADALQGIKRNSVFAVENPASAGSILSNLNPEKSRSLFKMISETEGDDLAIAAFGMNKQDYIISQTAPQVGTNSGVVRARTPSIDKEIEISIPTDEGGLRFTDAERDFQLNSIATGFKNANGLTVHDAESTFRVLEDGGKAQVTAMYGTTEGGFLRAEDAVDQAKLALRQYGITEDEITVMRKNGMEYVPVNLEDVRGVPGDYKVSISTEVEFGAELMGDGWEALDVKRNFFDRFSSTIFKGAGSVNRMLTDAASNLHPNLAGSFSVASDVSVALEKVLLKHAKLFSDRFNGMDKARKNKMWDYLLEANHKQLAFNITNLTAKGFTPEEIDTLKTFRNFWDMHYQLENYDVVRTLRNSNFQKMDTPSGDSWIARPIPKNKNHNVAYDPSTGSVRQLAQDELDELYANGGTVAMFKSPVDIDGTSASFLISRNNAGEYLRRLRDEDKVLSYREGYFQINYKAPQYIREVDGETMRAVAVRGDKLSAEIESKRLSASTGKQYVVTGDERDKGRIFDDLWDITQASGRIAQRRRGKPLEGADGRNQVDGKEFVENPIDSAIRAARSIATRTVSRPAIETAKARALSQYAHMLRKDEYGRPAYPNDINQIGAVGEYTTSELADARTTFEAIRRFESGYINSIDEFSKGIFNYTANALGDLNVKVGGGLGPLEKTARNLSQVTPSGVARGTAFQAYIATNPFRNWIMQPGQVARTVAYNPQAWISGDMVRYGIGISNYIMGRPVSDEIAQMVKGLESTGMLAAVDRSNLVRGSLMQASESSNKVMRGLSAIPNFTRTIGFDFGEILNLTGHYAAVWSKYKRSGADMSDKRVLAQIHSETRAISGEMNRAGDFAYNENLLSVPLQFAQVPHKFLLTATNRKIDRATRFRMMTGDLILWGIPGTYFLTERFGADVLPKDPELRDQIVSGYASYAINTALGKVFDDDTNIDFSSLAPYNIGGFVELMSSAMGEGGATMLSSTPSGQMFFQGTGRLGAAFNSLFRHFNPIEEGINTPETLLDTVNQFAKISSGWNNATKSWFAYRTGMAVDKYNMPTDTSVTIAEAVAIGFGFPTKTTQNHYNTIGKLIDNAAMNQKVAKDITDSIFQMYASAYGGENAMDPAYVTRLTGAALKLAEEDPLLAKEVYNQMKMRLKDPQNGLMTQILKAIEMPNVERAEAIIRDAPIPELQKEQLLRMLAAREQLSKEDN